MQVPACGLKLKLGFYPFMYVLVSSCWVMGANHVPEESWIWFDAIINSVGINMTSSVCEQQCWVAAKLKIHHIYWNKKLQINFQAYFEQSEAFFTEKRYSLYLNVYVLLNSLKPYEVETDGQIGTIGYMLFGVLPQSNAVTFANEPTGTQQDLCSHNVVKCQGTGSGWSSHKKWKVLDVHICWRVVFSCDSGRMKGKGKKKKRA